MAGKKNDDMVERARAALAALGKPSKREQSLSFLSSVKSDIAAAQAKRASLAEIAATLSDVSGLKISPRLIREAMGKMARDSKPATEV